MGEVDPTSRRGGMWIEFVGLPGAGKSTITRSLRSRLESAGYACRKKASFALLARRQTSGRTGRLVRASGDLLWATHFTLRNAGVREDLILGGLHSQLAGRYWRLMRTWAALVRLRRRDESEGSQCVTIFDQGILQCLRSIYPRTADQTLVHRLTRSWVDRMRTVLPDLVVLVCVDESTAAARMRSRPFQKTTWDLESPDLATDLTPFRLFAEDALPAALRETSTPILQVDGLQPPDQSTRAIMRYLQEMFSRVE